MKRFLLITAFLGLIFTALAQSPSLDTFGVRKAKALAIYAPPPKYPTDERRRRPTGRGIVLIDVDQKTGWVTAARMQKSTGSKLLDDAALEAFRRWRFRRGTVRHVHSPITFTVGAQPKV